MSRNLPKSWNEQVIAGLLTPQRLTSYHAASAGDLARMLALYEWNIEAAASVLALSAMAEVIVRNAIDGALCRWSAQRYGSDDWFARVRLDARGSADIQEARRRAVGATSPAVHGKMVAELSFGFWRYLTGSRYLTSLWFPAVATAFPGGPTDLRRRRSDVEFRIQQLVFVRNRAAHHEPLHRRDLARDLLLAIELISWVSPDAAAWALAKQTLGEVCARKP